MTDLEKKVQKIKLLILDVDGVLTDGRLFFDDQGKEYKSFHARDGHGIKLLRQTGVEVAVISGRKSEAVAIRMESLGIKYVYQGHEDKIAAFEELLDQLSITAEQDEHVGDDEQDFLVFILAGLAIAVNDAHFAVREYADWCTNISGGMGAVREVCDFIMQVQGNLDSVIEYYLK